VLEYLATGVSPSGAPPRGGGEPVATSLMPVRDDPDASQPAQERPAPPQPSVGSCANRHWATAELARRYGVSKPTVRKWRRREDSTDRPHCPHRLQTTLSAPQQAIVVALRRTAGPDHLPGQRSGAVGCRCHPMNNAKTKKEGVSADL